MLIQEFYSNMHGLDYSIPLFHTRVRGTRIVVTSDIVSEVLHVPRVEHPDYPSCECLRTMSKDELISALYEHTSDWGDRQFTPCSTFAKGPRFMNIVMTFVLHHLSHYNSITEPRARFLLSLLEHLTIDFPSHFIFSIIDVYRDTVTYDKLIFPSASRRFYAIFLFPFPFPSTSSLCVPLTLLLLNRARRNFIRGVLVWQLLPLLQLHPPPIPLLQ